jgi:uncharacterized membrane protein YphA (DoxX/SURF4 family)
MDETQGNHAQTRASRLVPLQNVLTFASILRSLAAGIMVALGIHDPWAKEPKPC